MQICSWKLNSWIKFNDPVTASSSRAVVKREVYLAYSVATVVHAQLHTHIHAHRLHTGVRFALIAIQFVINSVHRNVEVKVSIGDFPASAGECVNIEILYCSLCTSKTLQCMYVAWLS